MEEPVKQKLKLQNVNHILEQQFTKMEKELEAKANFFKLIQRRMRKVTVKRNPDFLLPLPKDCAVLNDLTAHPL
ncbi:hypothetical protein UY3_07491 [Chelonia mydas]|uniref:Uncharacterized protein n=1 Tax=Chelonia mydas TaxID=8469 RepID=M7BDU1_CHEMY|nr:hypothetical protein UY3_07491 [Chelonia mydas]